MECERFVYKRARLLELSADVYVARAKSRTPVLLLLHGGGLIAGGRAWFARYQIRTLLEAGYSLVAIDYRLAPTTKADEIFGDVCDALEWIRNTLPALRSVDGGRVGVMGYSAGGYLALLAGCRASPRPSAVVSLYGYGDVLEDWYCKPAALYLTGGEMSEGRARHAVGENEIADASLHPERLDFYFYCRQKGVWPKEVFGFDPRSEARFTPYRPVSNVDERFPPTLLIHGEADTDVPCEASRKMARTLKEHGITHELLTIPGAGHAFDLPPFFRLRHAPLYSSAARMMGLLSPLLPRTTFPGRAPEGCSVYMDRVLAFLATHLR